VFIIQLIVKLRSTFTNAVKLRFCELSYAKCLLNVVPSVLWHCWLGVRKSIWPTKNIEPDVICQQSVVLLNTELAPTTSIMGTSKANVQHLFSFVPKLSLSVILLEFTFCLELLSQGQDQSQGLGTKAKAKAKDFVIKAKAKAKATAPCPRGASRTRPRPRGHITAFFASPWPWPWTQVLENITAKYQYCQTWSVLEALLDLSRSRDVIIRSAIGHFLLVGNWYQASISKRFWDICI